MGRVFFCAVYVEKLASSLHLEWLQEEFRLRLQHSGARHFQLTFGVSFSSCSQGEWAGELPLEQQQALPSEFSLNAHPNSDLQLLAHIFFIVKRLSVVVKARFQEKGM